MSGEIARGFRFGIGLGLAFVVFVMLLCACAIIPWQWKSKVLNWGLGGDETSKSGRPGILDGGPPSPLKQSPVPDKGE